MIDNYTPGEGCECHAHGEAECGCDANWTPREVYELREQRDRLAEALELLVTTDHESKEAFIERVKQSLAAVKSESANINTKSESADIECQECLDQSRLLGMSAERECALLGKIDRIERERDEYKGILIELHNDINVIHSGNAIAKLNKMFKEENYN